MQHPKPYGVFVDCQMSSNAMAHISRSFGVIPVHFYSSYTVFKENLRALTPLMYEKHFVYYDDATLRADLNSLNDGQIVFVIPGSDSALPFCNLLYKRAPLNTKLFENIPYYPLDRYVLAARLGLECYPTVGDLRLVSFTKHSHWVVKPRVSRGGIDRVSIHPREQLRSVTVPDDSFITPFYQGTEYSVDVVSFEGVHYLNAVWRYTKFEDNPLKRKRTDLVHPSEEPHLVEKIRIFVASLLDGERFFVGATHTEVIVDSVGEVHLVEMNFRTQGQMPVKGLRAALGSDQPTETVRAHLGMPPTSTVPEVYETHAHLTRLNLFNDRVRPFNSVPWNRITDLPFVETVFHHFTQYDELPVSDHTLRLMTAKVVLVGPNQVKVDAVARRVQEIFHE